MLHGTNASGGKTNKINKEIVMEMNKMNIMCFLLVGMFVVGFSCSQQVFAEDEEGGNNLSLPVIWADGVTKVLRGTPGDTNSAGDYWMLWYEYDVNGDPVEMTCHPADGDCPDPLPTGAVEVYPQRDPLNDWQADSLLLTPGVDPPVDVDFVDWGDNLEAKNWYYRAIIRTETILHKDISDALMTGYEMIWLEGLGVDEVWGSTLNTYESDDATVYTGCARLTIQQLLVDPYEMVTLERPALDENGDPKLDDDGNPIMEEYDVRVPIDNTVLGLTWNPTASEWEGTIVGATHFNSVVWEATGSQDYEVYSAEINVKGKVIYGYNWNTRVLSDGPGYYRITFSMDDSNPDIDLNAVFDTTEVMLTEEVDGGDEANNETGGGIAVIDYDSDLSYIDVELLPKKGGGGNKPK
jgi:hypothetical protein